MDENKQGFYVLAVIAVVAIVAILMVAFQGGRAERVVANEQLSVSEDNVGGAIRAVSGRTADTVSSNCVEGAETVQPVSGLSVSVSNGRATVSWNGNSKVPYQYIITRYKVVPHDIYDTDIEVFDYQYVRPTREGDMTSFSDPQILTGQYSYRVSACYDSCVSSGTANAYIAPQPRCGDGIITASVGEQCDYPVGNSPPMNLGNKHCEDITGPNGKRYSGGGLTCYREGTPNACKFDTTYCVLDNCGNGVVDAGEECDGSNFNGKSCANFGYTGGSLDCTTGCKFDKTECIGSPSNTCGNRVVDAGEQCDASTGVRYRSCKTLSAGAYGTAICVACQWDTDTCSGSISSQR